MPAMRMSKMSRRKSGNMRRLLVFSVAIFLSCLFFQACAKKTRTTVIIEINRQIVINNNFYGFGAETLPWLWTKENKEAGVNDDDIKLNLIRTGEMCLPITRIFVPWEAWNPRADYRTFTWESDEMRSLYKTLDFYQETGTKVILVTIDWMSDSPWRDAPASAKAVLELLEHLVKKKGYSCIQFWTLTNEPELTYGWLKKVPFDNYIQIHRLVRRGIEKNNLGVKIIVSDDVESPEWFGNSLRYLNKVADIFSSHLYVYPRQVKNIPGFFRERIDAIKSASGPDRHIPFFLCEFGFRGSDFSARTNSFMEDYEYGLYVADLCVEALNSGVSAASLWCLQRIRLINEIVPEGGKMMRIGLWAYKDEGWKPYPVFYLYRLFTRYIKGGSKVLGVKINNSDTLQASCVVYKGYHSLFIVNLTGKKERFLIKGLSQCRNLRKYLYERPGFWGNRNRSFVKEEKRQVNGYLEDTIPAMSVILYTDLENKDGNL